MFSIYLLKIAAEWVKKEFVTRMFKNGIRKITILLEGNALRRLYPEKIRDRILIAGLLLMIFNTHTKMDKWQNDKELVKKPLILKTHESAFSHFHYKTKKPPEKISISNGF